MWARRRTTARTRRRWPAGWSRHSWRPVSITAMTSMSVRHMAGRCRISPSTTRARPNGIGPKCSGSSQRRWTEPKGDRMDLSKETITGGRMVTRELAEWVAELKYEDLPGDAVEEAGRVLADYLGESLFVGATKPWGQAIAQFCATAGGGQPEGKILASGG